MFNVNAIIGFKEHAKSCYPKEACGVIMFDAYVSCENIAEDPTKTFEIDTKWYLNNEPHIQCVLHSHTNGKDCPSAKDMRSQEATAKVWGICCTNGTNVTEPFFFGDQVTIPPLYGRQFRHGVSDCYSLIRDIYRLECNIVLPMGYRDSEWWFNGGNLYEDNFEMAGFERIGGPEFMNPQPYDLFLSKIYDANCKIPFMERRPNHGGVYLGNSLIAHHLVGRLSKRDPVGSWGRKFVVHWLRYTKAPLQISANASGSRMRG